MSEESLETRVVALEMRYMEQESTIQDLNEVILSQQREIDVMRRDLAELKEQMAAAGTSLVRDQSEEEPPPHY